MDKVQFHDKEIPQLDDMTRIGTFMDNAIKEVISSLVTDRDVVVKGMTVTQSAPTGMSVSVNVDGDAGYGMAIRNNGDIVKISSNQTVAIADNDSGSIRIDTIIGKEDHVSADQEYRYIRTSMTGLDNSLVYTTLDMTSSITVVEGTPGSGVAPATTAGYIKLAEVTVANGASSIVNANIKDVSNSATWTTEQSTVHNETKLGNFKQFISGTSFLWQYGSSLVKSTIMELTSTGALIIQGALSLPTVTATSGNFQTGYGVVPIGSIIPIALSIAGAPTHASLLLSGYAACDGTTPAAQGISAPTITATMPNINAGAFIRGAAASWTAGAANGGADTATLIANNIPAHAHSISITSASSGADHNHTAAHTHAFTSGNNSVGHTHGSAPHTHTGPSHTHTGSISSSGSHEHACEVGGAAGAYKVATAPSGNAGTQNTSSPSSGNGSHTHTFTSDAGGTDNTGSTTPSATGGVSANHTHSGTTGASGTPTTSGASVYNHTHAVSGNTGNNTTTEAAFSILPTYFNMVYYMRCK